MGWWEACAAEGQGGRSPAPVQKPGIGVGGGAFGLVRQLEEPLPRAAAAGVLEQQQPALLPCVAATVARGCGSGAKPGQRRRAGAFRTLGYARPIVQDQVAPERSRAVVRRVFTTGDRQGAEEESAAKPHLRAEKRPRLKRWGHRGGRLGAARQHLGSALHVASPSPYRLSCVGVPFELARKPRCN